MKEKRADRVLSAAEQLTDAFDPMEPEASLRRLRVASIAERAGVSPNNASMELARLHREGALARVGGRPAAYLSPAHLEGVLHRRVSARAFQSAEEFLDFLFPRQREPLPAGGAACRPPSDDLIGAEGSLRDCVEEAKAALL